MAGSEDAKQASQLESLTDIVNEKELDKERVSAALQKLAEKEGEQRSADRDRERALAKVTVRDGDVKLLVEEFDLDKRQAELMLRESGGDAEMAISSYLG